MRLASLLLATIAVTTVAVFAARTEPAHGVGDATLYVSGFEIGGKSRALLRLRNVSASDQYRVHYTVRDPNAGAPISRVAAGEGALLRRGATLELELTGIVNDFRKEQEAGRYAGPVQLVAFGTGAVIDNFGPQTVLVEAFNKKGSRIWPVNVEWRAD